MSIKVNSLSFSYRGHDVLHDMSFTAENGSVLAVLGPNGVGKSTLFRCMLGFLKPQKGSVMIDGRDILHLDRREAAQLIAYIPQNSEPVFSYTLGDLVLMGAAARLGVFSPPGREDMEKAEAVMDSLGILGLRDRECGRVSGGERQLALLARALVQDARVLIMDEPTANLDYGNQLRVMEHVRRLAGQDYAVIFSTHDPNQAFRYATDVLAIKDGRILACGAPKAVLTADCITGMYGVNAFLGHIDTPDGAIDVVLPGSRLSRDTAR